ncbi:hypothetical protein ICN17_01380 [Polynucleobacter sp. 73C-SIWE]|uniref:hypothetical protein n=1 Tax=Polynucleobacter sp. 73C-SIWE TaxID=2689098 RepID=UPI001C0A98FB|nr:hypothetical protein [Polynucleobacter sp. 73C-SIWE]MBU3578654.1 hypothetical protein [Polynucleobacter sp. 73C-SIWE]
MVIIHHQRNLISDLLETDSKYGIEIDIRSESNQLILQHDPYVVGQSFEEWLDHFQHNTLILNVKEEGLENKILDLMKSKNIKNYFFLDQSFPFLVKSAKLGERNCAVRVSEFESIDTALSLASMIDWVWVDCFSKFPLTANEARLLKESGLRLCIVSPELHGRNAEVEIQEMANLLRLRDIEIDAVCTKRPDLWETYS